MPHPVHTSTGNLTAMPLAWDLSDQRLLFPQHMATEECVEQVLRAFKTVYAAAADTGSGRMLTLTLTPWLMGQPHRIRALGTMLDRAVGWPATGAEIVDAWRPSTGS
jgi:allantoinase